MAQFFNTLPENGRGIPAGKKPSWKDKILHEMFVYWMTVLYLALYFGVFLWYRRLILAKYDISYENYGVALIEALILAKVILIGDVLRLGRGLENWPLIIPTLFRSGIFTVWTALFKLLEQTAKGLFRGEGWAGGINHLAGKGEYEYIADCLVVFFTFIPFFAIKELNQVMGKGKIWRLFFRRRERAEQIGAPGEPNRDAVGKKA